MFKILSSRHAYQRDAYFADPSVMLVSCLESSEEEIRKFSVNTILKMRAKPQKTTQVQIIERNHKVCESPPPMGCSQLVQDDPSFPRESS